MTELLEAWLSAKPAALNMWRWESTNDYYFNPAYLAELGVGYWDDDWREPEPRCDCACGCGV
jgi:hypothetical protein